MDPSLLGKPIPAPTANKPTGIMTRNTLYIIIGFVVVIIIAIILLIGSRDGSSALQQRMSLRQDNTLKLIADGRKNIVHGELQKINGELGIVLESNNAQLSEALQSAGLKKISKEITADETIDQTLEKLNQAKLNARYDSVYLSTLQVQLEALNALSTELFNTTKSKTLKNALMGQYKNVNIFLKQLRELQL